MLGRSVRCHFCHRPLGTGSLWFDVYCKDCFLEAKRGGSS